MATAIPSRIPAQTEERIHSPLHKLSGAIRRYIVLEAVAVFFLFILFWFWIGFALDFGAFKILGVDHVQFMPRWFRWLVLMSGVFLLAVLLTYKLVRLARQFRPEALALVLERRFPKLLRDRLITAVEMTDLDDAERCGYSRAMILKTVDEVSQLVDQIPIREVFNWRRLAWQWRFIAFMTLGLFAFAMAVDMGVHWSINPYRSGHRLWDNSSVWFERDVLIWDTLWPRRAYLELVDFPESGEMRVGRDSPSPRIQARALKWVVADRSAPSGWRAMTWNDLNPKLLDKRPVPALPTRALVPPGSADSAPPAADPYWTLDRVESLLATPDVADRLRKSGLSEQDDAALHDVFPVLAERAADPSMSRTFRKLKIPDEVKIYYWGEKIDNMMPMTRQQDANEFHSVLTDLKESVKFYVKGEDYFTFPDRTITLVPPPMLTRLERDEYVPAYLYHRPPSDGKPEDLKGLKQLRANVGTSLTGSTSKIEIESGSDMILRGEVDKDLSEILIRYRTQRADDKPNRAEAGPDAAGEAGTVEVLSPGPSPFRNFEKKFPNITRPIEFVLEFTDTDNVKSLRHIVIQPKEDRPPDVDVTVEVVRKTPQGYMVTAMAMIPFSGRVRDAEGLSRIDYTVNYMKVESPQAAGFRASIAAGVIGGISPSPTPFENFTMPALVDAISRMSESREAVVPVPALPLMTFRDMAKDRDAESQKGKEAIRKMLTEPAPAEEERRRRMINTFEIKPNLEFLDLQERIPEMMKAGENALIAPRFRMRVTVMAVDNNVETGPRSGLNKETFTFYVVPYEELLGEIAKDDQKLGDKLNEVIAKLETARQDIDKVIERMPSQPGSDEFRPAATRMGEIQEVVVKNHDAVQEVLNECNRLQKELETNRVPQARINSKREICDRLDLELRQLFPAAEEAHAAFLRGLEDRRVVDKAIYQNSQVRHTELIEHLKGTQALLGAISSADEAAAKLKQIRDGVIEVKEIIKTLELEAKDRIFYELSTLEMKADPYEIQKGERLVVAVDLVRDGYDGRYAIRLKPPDGSNLTIPATVQVPREAKRFQFEIIAGNTTGDFKVQLIPSSPFDGTATKRTAGMEPFDKKPFEIKVRVK